MKDYSIQAMIELIWNAFKQLKAPVPPKFVEDMGILVHKIMNLQSRSFHTPQHVVDLSDPKDPYQTLAAMFHDIVYYQVDQGFPPEIRRILGDTIREENREVWITKDWDFHHPGLTAALDLFGFLPGQKLNPFGGLNEFLSAVVLAQVCASYLDAQDLLIIMVCIEATIPFRGPDAQGLSWGESTMEKIHRCRCGLHLTTEQWELCLKRAVRFSNRDVGNFSDPDTGAFLDNTWKLLPETNVQLQSKDYTIGDYRLSLEKMERFFIGLKPEVIYKEFRGEPPESEYQTMVSMARRNVELAQIYLGIKLVSLAVVEALALSTGGDVPINLFLGEISNHGKNSRRLEQYLPKNQGPSKTDNLVIYHLLTEGRTQDVLFDMRNSPLSTYLCDALPPDTLLKVLINAREMFQGQRSPEEFLKEFPQDILSVVAKACAFMVTTRKDELQKFVL